MPKLLNLKEMIHYFVRHRVDVVTRRAKYELKKAEEREHILVGLKIALDNIDEVVQIIKSSSNAEDARTKLMDRFALSERQAQAILDMRLQKLTSLETKKIVEELEEIRKLIAYLRDLLSSEQKILAVVRQETEELNAKYGDDRRTEILVDEVEEINMSKISSKKKIWQFCFPTRALLNAYRSPVIEARDAEAKVHHP